MSEDQDALDEKFAMPVLVIQLSRVYDALMVLIRMGDPDAFNAILEAHSNGKLIGPAPMYIMEEDQQEE